MSLDKCKTCKVNPASMLFASQLMCHYCYTYEVGVRDEIKKIIPEDPRPKCPVVDLLVFKAKRRSQHAS